MPFSYSSYANIGGSPFQQYENQQQQNYLQQQQLQKQQQQNPAFGGQQFGVPQYGQQQQYGGQYNSLPNYNLSSQGFQPTPINQSDYTNFQGIFKGEQPQGQNLQFNPNQFQGLTSNTQIPNSPYNFNFNSAEQNYLKQQQPTTQSTSTNPYTVGYNSLPIYNPFQYASPAGGTGQFFTGF